MFKCPDCDYGHEKLVGLSIHFRKKHTKTAFELRVKLLHRGIEPTCKCGCAGKVRFLGIDAGFSEFQRGHQSRVHNNWGHNKEALTKSQDKRREQIFDGVWKPWNKGGTAESDQRIAENNRAISESILSRPEERQKRSLSMSINRLAGIVPTLTGSAHPQWSGGVSLLSAHCHANTKLYSEWKFPKLQSAQFKCSRCENTKPLHVHHDKERMADIIRKFSEQFGYVGDLKQEPLKHFIANKVADYHVSNNISGIVLCEECHSKEHASLNF